MRCEIKVRSTNIDEINLKLSCFCLRKLYRIKM